MSDLEADPVLMFQHRHYLPCYLLAAFVLPTLLPHLLWGESIVTAYFLAVNRSILASILIKNNERIDGVTRQF